MKKRTNPVSLFVMIAIIGLLVSFFNGDFSPGVFFEGLDIGSTEVLLESLSIGLAFLAFAGMFIYFIVRASQQDKPLNPFQTWVESQEEDDDEDDGPARQEQLH